MRKTDESRLLSEVLIEEGMREATLNAGLLAMRRKQRRRKATHLAAFVAAPLIAVAALWFRAQNVSEIATAPTIPQTGGSNSTAYVEGTKIRLLSDDELLSLFEGQPVALVGEPGEQRLLLFNQPVN